MESAERDQQIIEEGGRREVITLAGVKLKVGELSMKDRPKIFSIMEGDVLAYEKAYRRYMGRKEPGLVGAFKELIYALLGVKKKALGVMGQLMYGLTKNDLQLVELCTLPFTPGLSRRRVRKLFLNATHSEVQAAVKVILDINHFEVAALKKMMAAWEEQKNPSAPTAAAQNLTGGLQA